MCSFRKTLNAFSWTEYEPRGDFRLWINGQKSPISSRSPDPLFAGMTIGVTLSLPCWLLGCHGRPSHVSEDGKSKPQSPGCVQTGRSDEVTISVTSGNLSVQSNILQNDCSCEGFS